LSQKKSSDNFKVPMRRCIGCMESRPKSELVRIAYYEGQLTVDYSGRARGRGVYLCNRPECMELAKKKNALQRNFKTNFDKDVIDDIFKELMHVE
jgi:predicted RNA-binding protein YlxR (DUF448 family)